jgi:hypothetical protein
MTIKTEDKEFLNDMIVQLDESIRQMAILEKETIERIGRVRVEELREFWKQELSEEEERFFRMSMDYWDKKLIQIWTRTKRIRHTRAEAGHTFMRKAVLTNNNRL